MPMQPPKARLQPKVLQPRGRPTGPIPQAAAPSLIPGSAYHDMFYSTPAHLQHGVLAAAGLESFSVDAQTARKYTGYFEDFRGYCDINSVSPLPASPAAVLGYLTDCAAEDLGAAAINSRFWAIEWTHLTAGFSDDDIPTYVPALRRFRKNIERYIGLAPVNAKEPLPMPLFEKYISSLLRPSAPFAVRQLGILSLLAMLGLMRADDILQLQLRDIELTAAAVVVTPWKRKTTKAWEQGKPIAISNGSRETIDVRGHVERFLAERRALFGGSLSAADSPLFLGFVGTGFEPLTDKPVTTCTTPLSYAQWRYWFIIALSTIAGEDRKAIQKRYGLHSHRKAGATEMVAAGVPRAVVMDHGNWRSVESFERYLKLAPDGALAATAAVLQRRNAAPVTPPADLFPPADADIPCDVCNQLFSIKRNLMLLCDGCDKGFHKHCIGLDRIPRAKEWFCSTCAASRQPRKFTFKKSN